MSFTDLSNLLAFFLVLVLELVHIIKACNEVPLYSEKDFEMGYLTLGYVHSEV